jgi:hypothetical protein
MSYRVNADVGDIAFFGPGLGSSLDPSAPPEKNDTNKYGAGEWTRVLIDATRSWEVEPRAEWGWAPFPADRQDRTGAGVQNREPLGRIRNRHPLPQRQRARISRGNQQANARSLSAFG